MRIVNFNGKADTWIAWNKTYCYDLERQIVSLYDYLIYFNPDYVIFNSPTKEGALTNKEMENAGYQVNQNNKTYFYPKKLKWRQGFYNNSEYGDAFLVIKESDWYDETKEESEYWNWDYINGINNISTQKKNDLKNWFTSNYEWQSSFCLKRKENDQLLFNPEIKISLDSQQINCSREQIMDCFWAGVRDRQNASAEPEFISNDGPFEVERGLTYINLKPTEDRYYPSPWGVVLHEPGRNFPAGYVCIKNSSKTLFNIDDLLILPIGNGGLYNFNVSYKDLVATFRANELNNFAKTFSFNLGSNLRYVYQSDNKKINKSGSNINVNIYNQSGEKNIIADKNGNLWTGGRDLMPVLMHNGEDVFLDVEVSYNWRVVDSKSMAVMTILSNDEPPKIDIDVELF